MYWSPPERARLIDHDAAGPGTLGTEPGHGLGRNCLRIVSVHLHEYSLPRGTGTARSCRYRCVAAYEPAFGQRGSRKAVAGQHAGNPTADLLGDQRAEPPRHGIRAL